MATKKNICTAATAQTLAGGDYVMCMAGGALRRASLATLKQALDAAAQTAQSQNNTEGQ